MDYPFFTPGFCPKQFQPGADPQTLVVRSVLNQSIQTQGMPGKLWSFGMVLPATTDPAKRAAVEAWFDGLNGQATRVNIWHYGRRGGVLGNLRGYPMGTINTTGVQVSSVAAQFAQSVILKGCGAGATLLPGDMLGIGGQLIMNPALATADGSGVMTVIITGGLRSAAAVNDAVTLIRPTAQCVLADPKWRSSYEPGYSGDFGIDWIEAP